MVQELQADAAIDAPDSGSSSGERDGARTRPTILIADDDAVSRFLLATAVRSWGHEVVLCEDGDSAWRALAAAPRPPIAIVDWMMPGLDGVEVCRRARASEASSATYIILLTGRDRREDVIAGLSAGADDYMQKPYDPEVLKVRLQVGMRIIDLRSRLDERVRELEATVARVRTLQELLPICAYCKSIRSGPDYWQEVETYVSEQAGARLSHGVCPKCRDSIVRPQLDALREQLKAERSG